MIAGDIIGPFRLVRSLGHGSTGEVFLAERMESFPQRVAIKLIDEPGPDGGPAHEANILIALDHPHIVKLLDRGQLAHGPRYLVMEYVEGEPIDAYCRRHASTLRERVTLLIKLAEALSHAHRHLVIHADLKPPNILVGAGGEPTLLDFGVAQWLGRDGPASLTPAFASPEQLSGRRLTAASDVYSLGLVARALLPEPRERDLDSIIAMATRVDPDARYGSSDALKADLHNYLTGQDLSARRANLLGQAGRWVKRHRLVAATLLVITLIAAAAVGGVVRSASQASRQRALAQTQLHELVTLTGTLEGELYESLAGLPESRQAKQVLLQGAAVTLATLAERRERDSVLVLELARQYATLARLQLAATDTVDAPGGAARAALADLDEGMALLRDIGRSDPQYGAARTELATMSQWRAAGAAGIPRGPATRGSAARSIVR